MAQCKHHKICGRDADESSDDGLCILHSRNPEKDKTAFDQALAEHRDPNGPVGPQNFWDVLMYSVRVMLLLKPDEFVCVGLLGKLLNTLQSVAGPLLMGLFGLAVRQRLKR